MRSWVHVFLCGPGIGANNHDIRQAARDHLSAIHRVTVTYGEDIEKVSQFQKLGADMQTLENSFAHFTDLTIMILDSPGSFAELGTFSMLPNLRSRLIVLVPERFFGATSYIARGPLSLIAHSQSSNIVYFKDSDLSGLFLQLSREIVFYKFAASEKGIDYYNSIRSAHHRKNYGSYDYVSFISPIREKFRAKVALVAILCLPDPTFPEIILSTGFSASELTAALRALFAESKIEKTKDARYTSVHGFRDPWLEKFDTSTLSEFRAKLLASN